jgi:hypothetical protein
VVTMMRTGGLRIESEVAKMGSPGPLKAPTLKLPCTDKVFPDNKRDEYNRTKNEDDNIEC